LVLLPPAKASLEDMLAQGMVAAVRAHGLAVDIVLADVGYQQVMAGTVAHCLQQLIAPARAQGYRAIWLAGISLGAFNALHYAAVHGGELAGLCLLAPYPGTADILQEIHQAGGPQDWAAATTNVQDERRWWHWLATQANCPLWLGLAAQDRFCDGQAMLASLLPAQRVNKVEGDHSWPVWRQLWQHWLVHGPLATGANKQAEDR
jgi:pimeloyl-ACP methyl ester carboxylesterase